MLLQNFYREECGGCCPECTQSTAHHCQHWPLYEEGCAVHLPNGYSCGHLVGSPVMQRDMPFDAERFDEMLTEYDRILLEFGMHIIS